MKSPYPGICIETRRIAEALNQPHARCHVAQCRWLADRLLEALAAMNTLDRQLRQETAEAVRWQTLYGDLVTDWNALIAVLGDERHITVSQPQGGAWVWRVGEASGSAPSIAEAYRAALQHLAGVAELWEE